MPYVFTNTITTLPYRYQVKLELIKTPGTGATTVTNGGYIADLGAVSMAVDRIVGDVNPGDFSFTLINTGNEFSTNLITSSIDDIEVRLWLSYDAGTTWENVFAGFVDLESIGYSDVDATETRNRMYPISAKSALARLNDQTITTANVLPAAAFSVTRIPVYSTDETGTPVEETSGSRRRGGPTRTRHSETWDFFVANRFVTLIDVIEHCVSKIPFIAGATAPTLVVDYSDLEHRFYNDTSGLDYAIDTACLCAPSSPSDLFPGFFGVDGGPGGAFDAQNFRELLRRMCMTLGVVPIPRLWDNAGTLTYTVYLQHRLSSSTPSISGTLPTPLARAWEGAPWVQSVEVISSGLPQVYRATGKFAGKALQIKNLLHTTPKPVGLPDPFLWRTTYADPGNGDRFFMNEFAGTSQLFIRTGLSTVVNCHKVKILTSQNFFETSQIGYYGMAAALFDLAYDNASTNLYKGRKAGFTLTYPTLRGTSVWDLRPGLVLDGANQVAGVDLVVESVTRSIARNETEVKASKRTA